MAYVPTKRCDRLEKHDPHQWREDKTFKRDCPGRTTTKASPRVPRDQRARPKRGS